MAGTGEMRSGIHPPQRRRLALVIALVVAIVLLLRFWPAFTLLDGLELQTLDWRFTQRGPRPPHPDIVIVTVDQSSIAEIGRWPWPRRIFADVIRTVSGAGASAIVFDIFFADPDDSAGGAASDAELIDATREAGIVYHAAFGRAAQQQGGEGSDTPDSALASQSWEAADVMAPGGLNAAASLFGVGEVTAPLPGLIDAARGVGFVNVVDSGDGVYRHTFAVLEHEDRLYPSLSVAAAAGLLGAEPEDVIVAPGEHVELNDQRRIPLDRMGRTLVNFAGGAETYPFIPVREVLTMGERAPELARERFKDRIVLVAVTAPGLYDLRASPFDAVYYGVETQANALANILDGRFLRHAPGESCILIVLLLAVAVYLVMTRLRPTSAVASGVGLLIAYNWLASWFFERGLVIDVAAPSLALILATGVGLTLRLVGEERKSERVWGALARFVPSGVIERVVAEDPQALLRGHRCEVTVLFADIRNFTAKSEALSPEQTVDLLNRFFYLVHEAIWELEGTLDKYMGDGLMAFWNSPLDQPDHALLAVRAAVHIQRRIQHNQDEWEFLGMPDLEAGIGISTGEAVVGYVGTGERMQYTAIGVHVNLAARLESMTRTMHSPILVSASTWEQIKDSVEGRPLGPVDVRGFSETVEVYEVIELR